MIKDFEYIVVGAGISGATIAERIANVLEKEVLVIEKRNHVGGNCHDFYNKERILVPLYGPHFFHTNDEKVWKYVSQFTKWRKYKHQVLALVKGRLVPVPVNINTINILFKENLKSKSEMLHWLEKEAIRTKKPNNSKEVALGLVGKRLYKMIFENYTKKQWGKDPEELKPEVLARIPINLSFNNYYFKDKHQTMPIPNYTSIFRKMLSSRKIKVILNQDYYNIKKDINPKAKIFFTGRIDNFFQDIYGKLEYRSLNFEYQTLKLEKFQISTQVNYPEKEYPWTRITEPKHATGQKSKYTTIIYEYPSQKGEPYYPLLSEKNIKLYEKYRKEALNIETKEKVYFLGRLADYKYFNMDQAFKNALDFFEKIKEQI